MAIGPALLAGPDGALILVTVDHPSFFKVAWRHFDGHAVADQGPDLAPLHLARGIGNNFMFIVELYAEPGIRQHTA